MKDVTIQGTTYQVPQEGDIDWGESTSSLLEGLVDAVNDVLGSNDIGEQTFTLNNNIVTATNITGLLLDTSEVRGVRIDYTIYRNSDTNEVGETGLIQLTYINDASSGNKWIMSRESNEDAGITFTMTDAGQMQYISTDIGSAGYQGKLTYRAIALAQ